MLALQPLADGPAMFFGSTIMTFALPYGAFIAASVALYYLFRARHAGPRLRWSGGTADEITSVTTREPVPAPAPAPAAATVAEAAVASPDATVSTTAVPETAAPESADTEGKDGEQG
jgi:hypothetical protein